MAEKNFSRYILSQVKLTNVVSSCPFEIKSDFYSTKLACSSSRVHTHKLKVFLNFFMVSVLWIQLIYFRTDLTVMTFYLNFFYAISFSLCLSFQLLHITRRHQDVELFNAFQVFENKVNKTIYSEPMQNWELLLFKFLITNARFASVVFPVCYILQVYIDPCMAANAGRILLSECVHKTTLVSHFPSWRLFIIAVIKLWLVTNLIGMFALETFFFTFTQCWCYQRYMRVLQQNFQTDPARFWSKNRNTYQNLMLITRLHNNIHQDFTLVLQMGFAMFYITNGLFALIRFSGELTWVHLLLVVTISQGALFFIVIVLGAMSGLHNESVRTIQIAKERIKIIMKRYERRWASRLQITMVPLKISFGSVNFVDRLTTLVMLSSCISWTVSALLIY